MAADKPDYSIQTSRNKIKIIINRNNNKYK